MHNVGSVKFGAEVHNIGDFAPLAYGIIGRASGVGNGIKILMVLRLIRGASSQLPLHPATIGT